MWGGGWGAGGAERGRGSIKDEKEKKERRKRQTKHKTTSYACYFEVYLFDAPHVGMLSVIKSSSFLN